MNFKKKHVTYGLYAPDLSRNQRRALENRVVEYEILRQADGQLLLKADCNEHHYMCLRKLRRVWNGGIQFSAGRTAFPTDIHHVILQSP